MRAAVGHLAISASVLDNSIAVTMWALVKVDEIGRMALPNSTENMVKVIEKVAPARLGQLPDVVSGVKAWCVRVRAVNRERNTIIHAVWDQPEPYADKFTGFSLKTLGQDLSQLPRRDAADVHAVSLEMMNCWMEAERLRSLFPGAPESVGGIFPSA